MVSAPVTERGYVVADAGSGWQQLDDEETYDLQWPQSVWVYDRMRRQEAIVSSILRALTYPLRRTGWRVDPAGARGRVVQHVADDFNLPILGSKIKPKPPARTRGRFSWSRHLRLALLSQVFGHAYFEQQYDFLPTGPGGALQARLHKLMYLPPKTIDRFDVATDGGLNAIYQRSANVADPPRLAVDRLVAYVHDREGGNWMGQSVLRPAFGPWWLKQKAVRIEATGFDRNGLGIPVYTGSEQPEALDADEAKKRAEDERVAGLAIAQGVRSGENTGAYKPHGAGFELVGVGGRLPDIDKGIRRYNEEMADAVLANFLTLGGDNSTGSYALGDTFEDFFTMSLQTEATDVADTTTQYAVEDLVDQNYGTGEPAPRIVFDEIGSRLTAEAIIQLITAGAIQKDQPLEDHLRMRGGLPAADPATRQVPPPPPPAPPGQNPSSDGQPPQENQ
jgi:hypothetical protein